METKKANVVSEELNPTKVNGGMVPSSMKVAITITFDPSTGDFSLAGAVADPILFYGMLELARQTYNQTRMKPKEEKSRIHTV